MQREKEGTQLPAREGGGNLAGRERSAREGKKTQKFGIIGVLVRRARPVRLGETE